MGEHDHYGKRIFSTLLAERWDAHAPERSVDEGGVRADLDGLIWSRDRRSVECVVEIEARVYKQMRGAMVDLTLHPAPKKLLVVIRAQPQLGDNAKTAKHARHVWREIAGEDRGTFEVVCLRGTGRRPAYQEDGKLVATVLNRLGIGARRPVAFPSRPGRPPALMRQ